MLDGSPDHPESRIPGYSLFSTKSTGRLSDDARLQCLRTEGSLCVVAMSGVPDIEHFAKLQRMYLTANTNRYYSPTFRLERGTCEVAVEVRDEIFHSGGAIHGSVYFKLLDDSSYFAAASLDSHDHLLTTNYSVNYLRPVTRGTLRAIGTVVYRSQRVTVAESKAFDYKDRLVATGSGTFMPSKLRLDERVGY
jgi:uncharacterized protein (TIGR00369 family)